MAKPALSESAERLYGQLAPTFFKEDENNGWAGAGYIAALCKMIDPAAEIVQPQGVKPGYAILGEPANIPAKWLPWLAGLVGVNLATSPDTAHSREWIKAPLGFTRGTNGAMELAAKATLTGTKTLYFYPRYAGPFSLKVATLTSETASPTATREAIESMKPAWLVLEYETIAGGTYALLEAAHLLYAESELVHATYKDAELNPSA